MFDSIAQFWFGTRLGWAVKKEKFDKAADIIEKSCQYRSKKLGTPIEKERQMALDCFGYDEWNELRAASIVFKRKYCD